MSDPSIGKAIQRHSEQRNGLDGTLHVDGELTEEIILRERVLIPHSHLEFSVFANLSEEELKWWKEMRAEYSRTGGRFGSNED